MKNKINILINEKKYEDALKLLLLQEKEYLLKVQCLYELSRFEELIIYFEDVNTLIEDDYYEIYGYYILALIENQEFDKAIDSLNEELSIPYIQENYLEVLNQLYEDVLALKKVYLIENNIKSDSLSTSEISNILENNNNYESQLKAITALNDINIRSITKSIDKYLVSDNSPVLKTFILEVLVQQQVSDVVIVNKNNLEYEFLPVANQLVFQNNAYLVARDLIDERFEKNPGMLNMALNILETLAYIIYPNTIEIDEVNYICALIEYYIMSINYEDVNNDFVDFYCYSLDVIINNVDWLIEKLESEERFTFE